MLPKTKHTDFLLGGTLFSLLACIYWFAATGNMLVLLAPFLFLYMLICIADWRAAYWVLLALVPISAQIALADNVFSISLPDEPMCWLFALIFLLIAAHNPAGIPKWFVNNTLFAIVMIQLVWLCVAVGFSTVFVLSVKFLAAKIWYLICFLVFPVFIFKTKSDLKLLFKVLLVPIVLTMVIIQARLFTLHLNFASISKAVGFIYYNHVEYGAVISIFYPFLWVALPLVEKSNTIARNALIILILFFIPVIYFSFARAAVLALLFAILMGYAIRKKFAGYIMPIIYALIAVTIMYYVQNNKYLDLHPDYNQTIMHKDYSSHLVSTIQGKDMSSMERLYRWVAAIRMSVDRPITGYGPHGFVHNYKKYAVAMFKTYVSNNTEGSTTHNYFLFMLTEQGWPAMLLYALLLAVFFRKSEQIYHRFNDKMYKNCTLGLAMAFASCFVNNFFSEFIETHKVGAFFYLCIALLIILEHRSKNQEKANPIL
jgi:O-antigen ligase